MFLGRLAARISALAAEMVPTAEARDRLRLTDRATVLVERPASPAYGDYATPVALRVAAATATDPRTVASRLAAGLRSVPGVAASEVAGAGYVNVRLDADALAEIVRDVVTAGPSSGTDLASPAVRLSDERAAGLQDAYARLARLLRAGAALGVECPTRPGSAPFDAAVLGAAEARRLVCAFGEYPAVLARSTVVDGRTPWRRFDRYLADTLGLLDRFLTAGDIVPRGARPVTSAHGTRLGIVRAARVVVVDALCQGGRAVPDRR